MPMTVTDHVQRIGVAMIRAISSKLKKGTITLGNTRKAAIFYLNTLQNAHSEEEIEKDLGEMESEIPEMKTVVNQEQMHHMKRSEETMKKHIDELIKQGKTKEAMKLASEHIRRNQR